MCYRLAIVTDEVEGGFELLEFDFESDEAGGPEKSIYFLNVFDIGVADDCYALMFAVL